MRFIAKKEFDQAIETIELAIKNGQVRYGHHDNTIEVVEVAFIAHSGETVSSNRLSFVSPFVAAQQLLINTRKMLQNVKTQSESTKKTVEELETIEKRLAQLVPTLKE
jgi:hypothetical protein